MILDGIIAGIIAIVCSLVVAAGLIYFVVDSIKANKRADIKEAAFNQEKEFNRRLWVVYAEAINGRLALKDVGITAIYCGDKCVWSADDGWEDISDD